MSEHSEKTHIVFYHGDCPDGFAAAFAAWKALGGSAEYIPVQHHEIGGVPEGIDGKHIFVLDFSWPRDALLAMAARAKTIQVLDHHDTAKEDLRGLEFASFRADKSGCTMAWERFHPNNPVPKAFLFIQGRDIWNFDLEGTEEFCLALDSEPRTFKNWDAVMGLDADILVQRGRAMKTMFDSMVADACSKAVGISFFGHEGLMVNASERLASSCGDVLAKRCGTFGLIWRSQDLSSVRISLRSCGDFDVSKIAALTGGGGNRKASGMRMSLQKFVDNVRILETNK